MKEAFRRAFMALLVLALGGCAVRHTLPVYRIGVVLPLEGAHRALGLDVFFAARAAILYALENDDMPGYRVELVIYDDFGDPERAAEHARALTIDPTVLIVVGHWLPVTTAAALSVYREAGLPLITAEGSIIGKDRPWASVVLDAPPDAYESTIDAAAQSLPADWWLTNAAYPTDLPDADTIRERTLDGDPSAVEPGPYSALAYDALGVALQAIHEAARQGNLDRTGVGEALVQTAYDGFTGHIVFDANGLRRDVPLFLYDMRDKSAPVLLERFHVTVP